MTPLQGKLGVHKCIAVLVNNCSETKERFKMYKKISIINSITSLILIFATLALLGPQADRVMAGDCFETTTDPGPTDVACACTGAVVGSCPTSYVAGDPYDVCVGGKDAGYKFCNNTMQKVGETASCIGSIRWWPYSLCLVASGACGVICATPPWVQCAICLAALGKECTGCNIYECETDVVTPLWGLKKSSSGGECPIP